MQSSKVVLGCAMHLLVTQGVALPLYLLPSSLQRQAATPLLLYVFGSEEFFEVT